MGRLRRGGFIVEVGQCQLRSPHQRAVARSAAGEFVQRRRFCPCCPRGDAVPARRRSFSIAHVSGSMAGGYSRIPGYLIARLAIDTSLRGQGYGEQLLLDALGKAVAASEIGGGRLIVVDAIDDEAKAFYQHYHFVPVRKRERRLVMKVATAAKALGERWRE